MRGQLMTPILEARGLTKRFGKTQALAGLDLVARPGRVVALLGPNGAGKTTFVRAVATLLRPDAARRRNRRSAQARQGAAGDRPGRSVRGRGGGDDRPGESGDGWPPLRAEQEGRQGGGGEGSRR